MKRDQRCTSDTCERCGNDGLDRIERTSRSVQRTCGFCPLLKLSLVGGAPFHLEDDVHDDDVQQRRAGAFSALPESATSLGLLVVLFGTTGVLAEVTASTHIAGMTKVTDIKERRELQAQEGRVAWAEYQAQAEATREKTERLRAQRLANAGTQRTTTPLKTTAPLRTKTAPLRKKKAG